VISYADFLAAKVCLDEGCGFTVDPSEVNPLLKPHQRDVVLWAVKGGRRALFESFGLGKTIQQLEILRLILKHSGGGRALIVCPLGVRQEFKRDAAMLGTTATFIRSIEEAGAEGIYLTNYETVRDGKLDPRAFRAISLDEAGILRGFGGTKTFREFMRLFEGSGTYRFVATATPSPNEYIELLAYAAFLDVMDVGQAKTRFFKRDATKADQLTLHGHKEREFWLWVASWAVFLQRPSDIGHSDEGYELPAIDVRWHEVATDHSDAGRERWGQQRLTKNAAIGVVHAAREKRSSMPARIAKMMELRAEDPAAHRLLWHDLEDERRAIEAAIPSAVTVYGSQDLDEREEAVRAFSDGEVQELAGKAVMLGSGCNFQRHCAWAIFLGIGFKFSDFIQAIHRLQRFLQTRPVRIDLIYTEAEREVRRQLERKWEQHKRLVAGMTEIIREYGLARASIAGALSRSMGCERQEFSGDGWRMVNADTVEETARMEAGSVDLIVTSVPFSTQYEYTPSYNDFGHTDSAEHFFEQMDFLSPELLRVLSPGRIMAIHVKDRITPGGITGLGFQTVQPFHADCIQHYRRHGFAYLGMKTITTDVVRENNQTYRLGWTEQCKDGSRMGCGMPEYLLLFRKPPTDSSNGYADKPVTKSKAEYTLGRWQVDAHGYMRSSGNRQLSAEDLVGVPHEAIYKLFKRWSLAEVYDFDRHVELCESLKDRGILPVTFMLLPPHSWHPDVWSDVTRMRTLNGAQSAKGREMHLCPTQFDLIDRCVTQYSMAGETVYDPFAGLGTVPLRALKLGRRGIGVELNPAYCADALFYLEAAEREMRTPTLFDLVAAESASSLTATTG
jgi:DNA modification methylase